MDPFRHMVSKERPRALPGLVPEKSFSVVEEMEAEIKEVGELDTMSMAHVYE